MLYIYIYIYIVCVLVCMMQFVLFVYTNKMKSVTNNVNSTTWITSITATIVIQSLHYCKLQDYNVSATFHLLEMLRKSCQFSL